MQTPDGDIMAGVENMLIRCGGLRGGDRVLVVHEPAGGGYYCPEIADAVAGAARGLGLKVATRAVPFTADPPAIDGALLGQMQAADLTVFLARLGDQVRFGALPGDQRALVSYAIDTSALGTAFCRLDHGSMCALRDALDAALMAAGEVVITCPAGTEMRGGIASDGPAPEDTRTIRFPRLVNTPMPAQGFSGRVALRGFVVGTGSRHYVPYACRIDGTLFALIDGNRITGFDGDAADVRRIEAHYARVAAQFGIEERFVHSWHAGIHPGCAFTGPASASFERWTGSAFGNPRLLHFHTCGAYAPGEISLNILDATVAADGVALWEAGRLFPARAPGGAAVLDRDPDIRAAFAAPERACGAGPEGRLTFD